MQARLPSAATTLAWIFKVDPGANCARAERAYSGKMAPGNVVGPGANATINGIAVPVTYSLGGPIKQFGTLSITQSTLTDNVAVRPLQLRRRH